MSVKVESTTDTPEAVMAATGNLAQKESSEESVQEKPEPQNDEEGESEAEDSETSEQDQESNNDSEDSEEDEDGEDEKPSKSKKSRGGFKRRIDKLAKQRAQAEQERDFYREQYLKAQQEQSGGKAKSEKPTQQDHGIEKPRPDDFDDHDQYLEALTDYKAEQKLKSWEQKQREEQLRQESRTQEQKLQAQVQEFAKEHSDFNELVEEVADIPMSITVKQSILESDDGPALMYALAKDPERYEEICQMSPIAAARAIGKIEASLSSESPKPKPTKTTKAPKPPTPISSKSSTVGRKKPEDMSFQEFKKWREQQGGL